MKGRIFESSKALAEEIGISWHEVNNYIRTGIISKFRVDGRIFVKGEDLEKVLSLGLNKHTK